ncbi:MAG: hypothetical protein PHW76_06615 [Alphaproteobacteria bacterium]|nr:hypothetical protein [Alphaproteobacteria bacterium]
MQNEYKVHPSAGFAIGPILFVIAMFALLGTVLATGGNDFQSASISDRVNADVTAQANMIRNTINNCNLQYSMALRLIRDSDGAAASEADDPYPYGSALGAATDVRSLKCNPMGNVPLWGGKGDGTDGSSGILLPQPTKGFDEWTYVNDGATGGRCIFTKPSGSASRAVTEGLKRAAAKFNASSAITLTNEVVFNPASASQKFIVWITLPQTVEDADSNCMP